ncbi:hypothetical protein C1878_13960 [Gordonibacter sp. 28C]|uniref:thymidylate synthase n=1 Tax=Gordonibacter sp. 28C TaxID=2078569 RepID=UPI000DF85A4F|nr:thymidylate synthase [Gordonibacter sp. 28C]RDB60551.1 hypothetical protein C1878_13960 [Gordonibacter sp. 28C]
MKKTPVFAYRNINDALPDLLNELLVEGAEVDSRNGKTLEIAPIVFSLSNPLERYMVLPCRRNNVFSTIAETMWVLAGRDDLKYIANYLKRAADYSDDNKSWRGAYGPRLINWGGVNQLFEAYRLLREDGNTRRAVMSLFDPAHDFVNSKDIPCNNWIHFLIRDNHLDMRVVIRSNDAIWGLSGINVFEWSVILEIMSYWLAIPVGNLTFFISSLHLYSEHYSRAHAIVDNAPMKNLYDLNLKRAEFRTSVDDFDDTVAYWFDLEEKIRLSIDCSKEIESFPDPLFKSFLQMLEMYWIRSRTENDIELKKCIGKITGSDSEVVVKEYFSRNESPEYLKKTLGETDREVAGNKLKSAIIELHKEKDNDYGHSWKRRGEAAILENIGRKVDRIEHSLTHEFRNGETLLDTGIDLLVYSLKYKTYLFDQKGWLNYVPNFLPASNSYSDNTSAFEICLRRMVFRQPKKELEEVGGELVSKFELLYNYQDNLNSNNAKKSKILDSFIEMSSEFVVAACLRFPFECRSFIAKHSVSVVSEE